jgi:methionyl-tRNA formyltransferase
VVAAYGLILPQAMLDAPRRGCLNIHGSLLPRWRGAAPIHAAVLAGDAETGITIMQMDAGLDTGAMLLRQSVPITADTTTAQLHDALADIGAKLILEALASPPDPVPQPGDGATYAPKLTRDDGRIDWSASAETIDRRIRAFDPWPGTFTLLGGSLLKVLAARLAQGQGVPGTVLDAGLTVACGQGAIKLTRVQLPGRAALDADAFLRGHAVQPGTVLGL